MSRRLVLSQKAKAQINGLYEYVALEGSLEIADRYIDALLDRLAGLMNSPIAARAATISARAFAQSRSADASPSPTQSDGAKCASSPLPGPGRS